MHSLAVALLAVLAQTQAADAGAEADGGVQDASQVITLRVGTQKVLTCAGVTHVAVADPKVADVRALGAEQILVVGLAKGESGLLLFREGRSPAAYTLRVVGQGMCGFDEVSHLLGPGHRVDVRVVGDRLFIDGEVGSLDELERLTTLLELYPLVKNLAHLDPKVVRSTIDAINDALARAGLKNVRASVAGDRLVVEGAVADEQEQRKAQVMADSMFEPIRRGVAALRKASPAPGP